MFFHQNHSVPTAWRRTKSSAKMRSFRRNSIWFAQLYRLKNTWFSPTSWFLDRTPIDLCNDKTGTVKGRHILLQISTTALHLWQWVQLGEHNEEVQHLEIEFWSSFSFLSCKQLGLHTQMSNKKLAHYIRENIENRIYITDTFWPLKYSPPNIMISSLSVWALSEKFALRLGPSLRGSSTIVFFFLSASSSSLITCSKSSYEIEIRVNETRK